MERYRSEKRLANGEQNKRYENLLFSHGAIYRFLDLEEQIRREEQIRKEVNAALQYQQHARERQDAQRNDADCLDFHMHPTSAMSRMPASQTTVHPAQKSFVPEHRNTEHHLYSTGNANHTLSVKAIVRLMGISVQ